MQTKWAQLGVHDFPAGRAVGGLGPWRAIFGGGGRVRFGFGGQDSWEKGWETVACCGSWPKYQNGAISHHLGAGARCRALVHSETPAVVSGSPGGKKRP